VVYPLHLSFRVANPYTRPNWSYTTTCKKSLLDLLVLLGLLALLDLLVLLVLLDLLDLLVLLGLLV
jgi:hypothetical protein